MALAHILQEDGSARRMPTSIPYTQLAAVIQQLHRADPTTPSTRTLRRDMQKDVEDLANHNTPYGKLVQTLDLGIADGQIPFINPFALLFWVSCACVEFGDLLRQSVTDRARIVFYCDETKAGNVLRPDEGRSLQCIYWTLMDIPSWFRVRKFGWFTFSVTRSKLVNKLQGRISFVWRKVLGVFFGDMWNFESVGVRCVSSTGRFILRATFGCILGDEKAIREVWSVKGASGTKMCLCCKNVVGRMHVERGGYLAHHTWATPDLFDPHSDDRFEEMVQILLDTHMNGTQKKT